MPFVIERRLDKQFISSNSMNLTTTIHVCRLAGVACGNPITRCCTKEQEEVYSSSVVGAVLATNGYTLP